jgi:hypothetical protein
MSVKPTRAQQMANEDSAEVARAWAKRCATLERELAEAQATIETLNVQKGTSYERTPSKNP